MRPSQQSFALTAIVAASSAVGVEASAASAAFACGRNLPPAASLARVSNSLVGVPLDMRDWSRSSLPTTMAPPPPPPSFRQRRSGGGGSRSSPQRRALVKSSSDATEEDTSTTQTDEVTGGGDPAGADTGLHRRRGGARSPEANGAAPPPRTHSTLDGGGGAASTERDVSSADVVVGAEGVMSWFAGLSAESVALLNLVAVIWGTQHSVIKTVVDDCDASAFSLARFGLGAILASRYTPPIGPAIRRLAGVEGPSVSESKKADDEEAGVAATVGVSATDGEVSKEAEEAALAWRWGLEMGTWMFLGYAFQAVGLAFTTAQRSGFLLYLNVKFVPFFARILFGRDISAATWASAFTALAGTALLSYDGSDLSLNVGDLWSVAAAAASAMFILRLESASGAVKDSSALNAASLWVVAAASLVWTIGKGIASPPSPDIGAMDASRAIVDSVVQTVVSHPFALIYLGGVTTALANYIQTKAQKDISAERASIIYAMDPVYGAFFASLLLGESLNSYGIAGAGLITLAAATNAFLDLGTGNADLSADQNEKT